ncbi:MAG: PAS domain S-box protein [Chitinophagaceae bacterium]|nr:PAS domain S-box protein [Chitinophagaceae bacterium]
MKRSNFYTVKIASFFVMVIGVLTIVGWQFDIDFLKEVLPTSVAMNPLTAVLFIFLALSCFIQVHKQENWHFQKIAISLVILVLLISVLKLLAFFRLFESGIDHWLYKNKTESDMFNGLPNSMAPNTAAAFLFTSSALLFSFRFRFSIAQYLALLVSVVALLSLIGYSYDIAIFYGIPSFLPMAFNTAVCFILLSLVILFSSSNHGFVAEFMGTYGGARAGRILLPASIAIPFMLGFFILDTASKNYYSIITGVSLLVTAIIFVFGLLIWITARSINVIEKKGINEKQVADERIKNAAEHIFDLYNNAPCGYHTVNQLGTINEINKTELDWLGYTFEEVVDRLRFQDIVAKENSAFFWTEYNQRLFDKGVVKDLYAELICKNGAILPVLISAVAIKDFDGKLIQSRVTVLDYTERKRQDDKIKQFNQELEKQVLEQTQLVIDKEQKYRFLLQNMREGILIVNYEWCCLFVNTSLIRQSRQSHEDELLGYTLMEKFPGLELTPLFKILEACMQNRLQELFETEFDFPDGSRGWFKLSVQPVPEGLFILVTEITEQKRAEAEFQQSQIKYKTLLNSLEGIFREADAQTFAISFISKQAERLLGYPAERWMNEPTFWADHIHEEDRDWAVNYCQQATLEKRPHQFEYRMIANDGRIVWLRDIVSLEIENGEPIKLSGLMVDITERKKMEEELSNKKLLKQKLITEITILAQEKERNELGKELHDNINQILSVVKLYMGMAKLDHNGEKDFLGESYHYLEEAMNEIRKLSHSLVAPSLGEDGLKNALEELVESVNQANSNFVQLSIDDNYQELTIEKNKELTIYRIIQEQLNNILKYAKAGNVNIAIKKQSKDLYVAVSDNGVGFDVNETDKGIGLKNISSRVNFYSGSMNIITAPGKGCTLEVFIPY